MGEVSSGERDVMRDLYRHHLVVRACLDVFELSHPAVSGKFGLSGF